MPVLAATEASVNVYDADANPNANAHASARVQAEDAQQSWVRVALEVLFRLARHGEWWLIMFAFFVAFGTSVNFFNNIGNMVCLACTRILHT